MRGRRAAEQHDVYRGKLQLSIPLSFINLKISNGSISRCSTLAHLAMVSQLTNVAEEL